MCDGWGDIIVQSQVNTEVAGILAGGPFMETTIYYFEINYLGIKSSRK